MKNILKLILTLCIFINSLSCWGSEFYLGVGTHIWGQDGNKNVGNIKELQINSVRDEVLWDKVELDKGKISIHSRVDSYFSYLSNNNVTPLIILAYGNPFYDHGQKPLSADGLNGYTYFASSVVGKLRGGTKYYEIWNEYDHRSKLPTTPQSYMQLVKAATPAVKAADPDAKILIGAVTSEAMKSGWINSLVSLGGLKYADGISIHPYIHCEKDNSPESWIIFLKDTAQKLNQANNGKEVPLYITEMGWPSNKGACGTSPEIVAQYLARAILLVRTVPEVKGFWWYDLKNDGIDRQLREYNFGLLNYDYSLKPAFKAFQDVSKFVIKANSVERQSSPTGVVSLVIIDNSGMKAFALWSDSLKSINTTLSIVRDRTATPSILKVGTGKSNPIITKSNMLNLTLDGTPQIVTGIKSIQINKID